MPVAHKSGAASSKERFLGSTIISQSVHMPLVEIKWWKGRDDATKAKAIELVTKAICDACGVSPEHVTVIIQDIDKASWGRAGKPSA